MGKWRYGRLIALIATAVLGLGWAYAILWSDDPARWLAAIAGILAAIGGGAAFLLVAITIAVIVEDVRPALRFRKPVVELALSHRESALVGYRAYRHHPVRFWGGLTLNNSFFVGFILFGKPEFVSLREEPTA